MLHKCVNPVCGAQFRYLHQGKLFEVETQYLGCRTGDGPDKPGNGKGHVERCWLCDQCAAHNILRFDAGRGVVMFCCLGNSEEGVAIAIPQFRPNAGAGIARVLIRPFDLTFDGFDRRKAAGELSARRSDAA